ncbi:alcohol dehydrogenase catalytic domain-containing protein [Nocardia jiangxiensis]|uniref:alcohol dehydrogenase catalytic domain-containing protein n=1 Tax=Nocardia jiangxiensis TaxID=282685 RepID=UPI0005928512|nr:alcohol dehydrogenase catalytic domain-containing protein [Nocardia jiangxiensis]
MRAYKVLAPGRGEMVDIERPQPGPSEVLLRVAATGVCHSDVFIRDAIPALKMSLPVTLGHEVVGVIEELGVGVSGWTPGQQAAAYVMRGCGSCAPCRRGLDNFCHVGYLGLGTHFDGGMAEFMAIPADAIADASGLDPIAAAPLTDAGLTALHTVNSIDRGRPDPERIMIIGIGGLGHLALQIATYRFHAEIIAVDRDPKALELARKLGADSTVLARGSEAAEILAWAGGREIDVVLDFVGSDSTLALAAAVTNRGAQILVAGLGGGSVPFQAVSVSTVAPEVSLLRVSAGSRHELAEALDLGRAGVMHAETVVYPLEQAGRAIDDINEGKVIGRAVLVP